MSAAYIYHQFCGVNQGYANVQIYAYFIYVDDIAVDQNGQDVYLGIKEAGRYRQAPNIMNLHAEAYELMAYAPTLLTFRECSRTHGVSSTKLIQRYGI